MRAPLVLAYHGLGRFPRALDPYNLMLDPDRFREHVGALRRRRYRFLALRTFVSELLAGRSLEGCCVLTFDDGTLDNLELLAPLLEELELPATIFVCPGLLGSPHFAMPAQAGVRLMDAEELRRLSSSPLVELGSHTNTHRDLSHASLEEAVTEMVSSREALEAIIGAPVHAFAYPRCVYSQSCPQAAQQAGYEVAVTCEGHGVLAPYELYRESIVGLDGRLTFELKSRGLFLPLRNSMAGRLARTLVRPLRHGMGA
jgi:peptidoglycan/xylan/chitin deacetylase (PgdA/CDA1 family)